MDTLPPTTSTCNDDCRAAEADFLHAHPAYASTRAIDHLRATEYERLDRLGQVYLDYTGGGLFARSQLDAHLDLLANSVLGNPHSVNPTSQAATDLCEAARRAVLRYFNASPDDYEVVFTANASGALKIVGESYPFDTRSHYLLTYDNHNSVNGIREYAKARGAEVTYIPLRHPDLRIADERIVEFLDGAPASANHKLFAFPAQSNFSGVQHPLRWIDLAHERGWDVLLDAAAFAPTNRLDLSVITPDYVDLSFYKMFGYPTGIGALIARKPALEQLERPWFAGGTVTMVSVNVGQHQFASGAARFEDGTINYLGLPAVEIGLKHLETVGVDSIHERVLLLTAYLLTELQQLRHSNGNPLVQIYGPTNCEQRGATIALNFFAPNGNLMNHRFIEQQANAHNLSLRSGAFCNPGGGEIALGLPPDSYLECLNTDSPLDDFSVVIDPRHMGAIRVSLGIVSNFADVWRLLDFARSLLE